MTKGNIGEWSEIYVLLKLLGEGKLFAADEDLNKLEDLFFPIIKVIRKEDKKIAEYIPVKTSVIEIYIDGVKQEEIPMSIFDVQSKKLFEEIQKQKKFKGTFSIEETETFMNTIKCFKIKAPSTDKSDIKVKIIDIHTGYSSVVGFSIKSQLGKPSTLLNASGRTGFIYEITSKNENILKETNDILKIKNNKITVPVKERIKYISDNSSQIKYHDINYRTNKSNKENVFKDNLILIDSFMDKIIAETLLYFYRDGIFECKEMVKKLEKENPFQYGNINAYSYKFKKFLTSVALGMQPGTKWKGTDEASGGYIIVTKCGEVVAYHIYNRNYFEEYLLNNTRYEVPSTSRHNFGSIYTIKEKKYINLNLQIRFLEG
jgi:type II restriction endonuclease hpaII